MAKARARRRAGNGNGPKMAGEFRTGPVAGTAIVQGVTFARRAVQFAEVDKMAIFEGDILLGPADEVRAAAGATATQVAAVAAAFGADAGPVLESIGITGQQFRWPNATVVYEIDSGLPNQQRVHDAISHWEANTRIRFVERTPANASQHPDFVRFVNGGGCSSNVGRRTGPQTITLGSGCSTGNAIHEIGHTVGLWHEQSREDRDTFVRIEWANIDPSHQHNFDQHIADGDDLGPYDYGSIMHYPATAFSINGQPTIVALQPLPPGVVMGQRNGLSAGDIAGVHAMYPPGVVTIKETAKDPIGEHIGTIKEVRKDPIFDPTFKEVRKDPIFDPTFKELARDPFPPFGRFQPFAGGVPAAGAGAGGATPFVLAGQGQYGGAAGDQATQIAAQVQALGEAITSIQQELDQVKAAYDATVQSLGGAGGLASR